MKTRQMMTGAAVGLILAQTAWGGHPFKVSARKMTVSKDQSAVQQLPRGTTRLEEKEIVYEFEIKNQSTEYADQELYVRWMVVLERANGRSFQTPPGEKTTTLPFGRAVTVETSPIPLSERTWQRAAGPSGTTGQILKGYGLQILTREGEVLMETYDPGSLADEIRWQTSHEPSRPDRENLPDREDRPEPRRRRRRPRNFVPAP